MISIKIRKEEKEKVIQNIRHYFLTERDEEIGELAADLLFQFMCQQIGTIYYNQGVNDATKLVQEKLSSMEEDLYCLIKPVFTRK
jgi:uncharacterized protein (DUF2164 family)